MIADPSFGTQNDIFNNPKTTDIKFLISWKFEVTILLRKSEGIKSLPNRLFTETIHWVSLINRVEMFSSYLRSVTGSSATRETRPSASAEATRMKLANILIYNSASKAARSLRRWKKKSDRDQTKKQSVLTTIPTSRMMIVLRYITWVEKQRWCSIKGWVIMWLSLLNKDDCLVSHTIFRWERIVWRVVLSCLSVVHPVRTLGLNTVLVWF